MRLFIAIPLTAELKKELNELQYPVNGLRWKDFRQFHLTLRFVGEAEREVAESLENQLKQIKAGAFDMAIKGFGYFPRRGKPRVLWAGIVPSDSLLLLQKKVEEACTAAGLKPENRSFNPHITLAKVQGASKKEVLSFISQSKRFRIEPIPVTKFVLYSSMLSSDGAKYKPLQTYPLLEDE